MPKWLISPYNPKNDEGLKMTKDYPKFKNKKALEWIKLFHWCKEKIQKSTHIIDINKDNIDPGPGYINCFEYLKWYVKTHYKQFLEHDYLQRYVCFHDQSKFSHPWELHLKLNKSYGYFIKKLTGFVDSLQELKNFSDEERRRRVKRYYNKNTNVKDEKSIYGIKPRIDTS